MDTFKNFQSSTGIRLKTDFHKVYGRYKPGIDTRIRQVYSIYLILPQVPYQALIKLVLPPVIPGWYVLQYHFSYHYHIPGLHPTYQYNTGCYLPC
jgi:hypothetical protein